MHAALYGYVCLLVGATVAPPVLLTSAEADYPAGALAERREAQVILRLDIAATGEVTSAEVTEPVGSGFDEAAVAAAMKFVFEPAKRDDVPIAARILYTYTFALEPIREPEEPSVTPDAEAVAPSAVAGDVAPEDALVEEPVIVAEDSGEEPLEIEVRGARVDREVTVRTVSREELRTAAGTNGDALRAVQNFPGVARAPGLTGQIVVRGSAPFDTEAYVDGNHVPYVYHFGGLSSVLPTEVLDGIDLYPGNFGAKFGRVTGGIVDVHTRSAGDPEYHAMGQIDLIDARALARGPIAGGWTFIAGARRSWIDSWLGPLLAEGSQAPFYYDGQLFVEKRFNERSRLKLGFYGSYDALRVTADESMPDAPGGGGAISINQGFWRLQANYDTTIGARSTLRLMASYGQDTPNFSFAAQKVDTRFNALTTRADLEIPVTEWLSVMAGYDVRATQYRANVRASDFILPGQPDPGPYTTARERVLNEEGWFLRPAAYIQARIKPVAQLEIVPALRVDYDHENGNTDIGPRFNARYDLSPIYRRTTLKGAVGLYYRPQVFELSVPVFGRPGLKSDRALEASLGVEQELTRDWQMSVEGFYKSLDNLVSQTPRADGGYAWDNNATGRIFGAELLLRYAGNGPFGGSLAYTLSRSTRVDNPGEARRMFEYDQTHVVTALASYKASHGWTFSSRFRFVSGNPYTPCAGGRYAGASGTYACIDGAPFSDRLPAFHQLDIRIEKQWAFTAWKLSAYVDIINAYNRKNPEGQVYNFNYTSQGHMYGLPFIPSFGVRGEL